MDNNRFRHAPLESETFMVLGKRSTYENLIKDARERQKGSERGWWDDNTFLCTIENKLKRTKE